MPTYMYKCRDCGHRFEEVQGFHDDPLQVCPDCGGTVQRVIGNVGVTFKGSGFYRTDSRSSKAGSSPAKSADKAPDTAAAKSSDKAADGSAKPAPKSDSGSSPKPKGSSTTP